MRLSPIKEDPHLMVTQRRASHVLKQLRKSELVLLQVCIGAEMEKNREAETEYLFCPPRDQMIALSKAPARRVYGVWGCFCDVEQANRCCPRLLMRGRCCANIGPWESDGLRRNAGPGKCPVEDLQIKTEKREIGGQKTR
ncbi:hypothetical protein EYF80_023498 [Liparis tanakae]|uniref:Uncharacterized protein n=1 Tax=Liparis tanakae TaxID=230148 RepID=A0A4Z2HMT8_9TELE|nr:hypothetical protein EYF80_023498 [Liparis tanakae]